MNNIFDEGLQLVAEYSLKSDKNFIMQAVRINGQALEYASEKLQNNRDMVMTAVQHDKSKGGLCLWFAIAELQNDREIVSTAIDANPRAFQYASSELQVTVI